MKKNCYKKPFWELNLNPIDMMPPLESIKPGKKKYYQKNKEAYKIRNLTNHLRKAI